MSDHPILFCIAGPGGSGKSTICQKIVEVVDNLVLSISSTTREPRKGEVDGEHYFFLTPEEFRKRSEDGLFLERAEFNGNLYGTELRNIERAEKIGADLLLEIETQGVKSLKERTELEPYLVTIFTHPPSMEVLEERLRNRKTDSEEQIQKRLTLAKGENEILSKPGFSDYFLFNDTVENAVANFASIIRAERQKMDRISLSL